MDILLVLSIALVIDLALGELPCIIHPVVGMGKVISLLERGGIRCSPSAQFVYGVGMVLVTLGLFVIPVYFILFYLKNISFAAYLIVGAVLLKSAFSIKELRRVAKRVKQLLLAEKLDAARLELQSLVGRNTRGLSRPLLVSATVESVAENTCDSFVAPLFYFLFLGVPGAIAYRVVNTLDSMIGYHGQYEYLGKFASRLDDVLNFVPARLTALLLVLANFLSRRGARGSWQVVLADHANTGSPNAGWTMAAVAGALNVQLEKVGHYKVGSADVALVPHTIDAALALVQIAMLLWVMICFIAGGIYFVVTT